MRISAPIFLIIDNRALHQIPEHVDNNKVQPSPRHCLCGGDVRWPVHGFRQYCQAVFNAVRLGGHATDAGTTERERQD